MAKAKKTIGPIEREIAKRERRITRYNRMIEIRKQESEVEITKLMANIAVERKIIQALKK